MKLFAISALFRVAVCRKQSKFKKPCFLNISKFPYDIALQPCLFST